MKNIIKLNESQLKKLISESVKRILKEDFYAFDATSPDFWKNQHKYNDEKANRAADYMANHYGYMEEDGQDFVQGDYNIPSPGFYICIETVFDEGSIQSWIGDENDAEEMNNCSEGNAFGPFKTYEEAENYAKENGIKLGEDNLGDENDESFGLNENRLDRIIKESIRKVLK